MATFELSFSLMQRAILLAVFIALSHFLSAGNIDDLFDKAYSTLNTDLDKSIETVRSFKKKIYQSSRKEREKFYHQAAFFYATIGDFGQEEVHRRKKLKLLPSNSDTSISTNFNRSGINSLD